MNSGNTPAKKQFMTMGQSDWQLFDRDIEVYDIADSMHIMCPQVKGEYKSHSKSSKISGFCVNPLPGKPVPEVNEDNILELWHEQIKVIKELGIPFDFWGVFYSTRKEKGPGRVIQHCQLDKQEYDYLIKEAGHLFLGWEIGEFDGLFGRDVVYYWSPEKFPKTRKEAHDRLVNHLKAISGKLYNNVNALCGLTFPHYFNKIPVKMLGAEVAQGLLNFQVYVSFLRGAFRQYNLKFKIITSVYDRWGYRSYTETEPVRNENGSLKKNPGPWKGHSVNLLKAMWVLAYFQGASIVGLEGGFYSKEIIDGVRQLSPLGKAFKSFREWSRNPLPAGKQIKPLAMILDYHSGWTPPRHLYSLKERVVWHCLPYSASDHAVDRIYDMFYPGYGDAGFYRDERGFIAPTPSGDIVDILLTDASMKVLQEYPLLWFISDETPGKEIMEKLRLYVNRGGRIIISGKAMLYAYKNWFDSYRSGLGKTPGLVSLTEDGKILMEGNYSAIKFKLDKNWSVYSKTQDGYPVIFSRKYNKGKVTFISAEHGLTDDMTAPGLDKFSEWDYTPDPPRELLHSVKRFVSQTVRDIMPVYFDSDKMYYSVNKVSDKKYLLCIYNQSAEPCQGTIRSKKTVKSIVEKRGPWDGAGRIEGFDIYVEGNALAIVEVLTET